MSKPRASPPKRHGQPPPKADWDRDQLSLRLTATRRERLLRIAADMPAGSTPSEAVDRAVERALATPIPSKGDATASRLEALEEWCERFDQERKRDAAEARATRAATLREVRGIAELMSVVAAAPSGDGEEDGWEAEPIARAGQSMRAWLDSRRRTGQPFVAVGRWRSKTRLADGMAAVEFEVAPTGSAAARSVVRVSPLPASNELARVDEEAPIRFACQRQASGSWSVEARHINADRSLGALICHIAL